MITEPGIYEMSAEEYHLDPCPEPSLSASIAKLLLQDSPLHAWNAHLRLNPHAEADDSTVRDIGVIAHALLLRDLKIAHVIRSTNKEGNIVTDYKTKAAREERDGARLAGRVPILECDWTRVQQMIQSVRRQLAIHKEARGALSGGHAEQVIIWREDNGLWCRAMMDYNYGSNTPFIDDLKTRSATSHPDVISRTLFKEGWDIQAAFYLRGYWKLFPQSDPMFRFICAETYEPHGVSVVSLTPGALVSASKQVEYAIDKFQKCLKSGSWEGYGDRIAYAELPVWLDAVREQQELTR